MHNYKYVSDRCRACALVGHGPKTAKLFTNQPHTMDFDQAEAQRPVQQLDSTPDDLLGDGVVGLSYVKYQNVQNLMVSKVNVLLENFRILVSQ